MSRKIGYFLLALIPLALAVSAFRSWSNSETAGERSELPDAPSTLQDSKAEGVFYIDRKKVLIDGKTIEWPQRYYFFDSGSRVAAGTFEAEKVLWVANPEPKSREDLASLLRIETSVASTSRKRALMEEALQTHSGGWANRGLFVGGESFNDAERMMLSEGAELVFVGDKKKRYTLEAEEIEAWFTENEPSDIEARGRFSFRGKNFLLSGVGLSLDEKTGTFRAESDLVFEFYKFDPLSGGPRMEARLRGAGPLVFTPDPGTVTPGELSTMLEITSGKIELEELQSVELRDGTQLLGDRIEGQITRRKNAEGREEPQLDWLEFQGGFFFEGPAERVTGNRARYTAGERGGFDLKVFGKNVSCTWRDPSKDGKAAFAIHAQCRDRLSMTRHPLGTPGPRAVVEMKREIQVTLGEGSRKLILDGESLEVDLVEVSDARADADEGKLVLAFGEARLGPKTRGRGTELALSGGELKIRRGYNDYGAVIQESLSIAGPAETKWRPLAKKDGRPPRFSELRVNASEELTLQRPLLSDDPLGVGGAGDVLVVVRESGEGEIVHRLEAEEVRGTLVSDAPKNSDAWKTLFAEGKVKLRSTEGRFIDADRVQIDRDKGHVDLVGTPAIARDLDLLERPRSIIANSLSFRREAATLTASGDVDVQIWFTEINLTRGAAGTATSDSEEVHWTANSQTLLLRYPGAVSGNDWIAGPIREIELKQKASLVSALQSLKGEHLFFNIPSELGWAKGSPVEILAKKKSSQGVAYTDRLSANQIDFSESSCLFRGKPNVLVHIPKESANGKRRAPERGLEALHLRCENEVLIRGEKATFAGKTIAIRGDPKRDGIRLDCDSVVVRFVRSAGIHGLRGIVGVEALEGYDNVTFGWQGLTGGGDIVVFDYINRVITLSAIEGRDCHMKFGSHFDRQRSLSFDMHRKIIRGSDGSGRGGK